MESLEYMEVPAEQADDPRTMPLETLRAWYADRCEESSVRQVAMAVGIGRTTMRHVLDGDTDPHPRVRLALARYYARMCGDVEEQRAADARTAYTILAGFFPPEQRADIVRDLLDTTERGFAALGMDAPGWIARLRE
jgi:hypothetical protein